MRSLTFGNGRTLAKAYDQNYWIDTVTGTPAGLALDFGTDEVGNIVGLTVGAAANNRVYDYDDLNRLTSETRNKDTHEFAQAEAVRPKRELTAESGRSALGRWGQGDEVRSCLLPTATGVHWPRPTTRTTGLTR